MDRLAIKEKCPDTGMWKVIETIRETKLIDKIVKGFLFTRYVKESVFDEEAARLNAKKRALNYLTPSNNIGIFHEFYFDILDKYSGNLIWLNGEWL